MVNIITLPTLFVTHTEWPCQETEQKQILGGKSVFVTIYSTLCDVWEEFHSFSAWQQLPWPWTEVTVDKHLRIAAVFLPSSLNWLLKAFFQKLEFTLGLVKLKRIRGQVSNTLHISQKHLLLFLPDSTHLFLLYPKAVPNTDQTRSYTDTGGNTALPFPRLRLHVARLHSHRKVWLCEHMTAFETKS